MHQDDKHDIPVVPAAERKEQVPETGRSAVTADKILSYTYGNRIAEKNHGEGQGYDKQDHHGSRVHGQACRRACFNHVCRLDSNSRRRLDPEARRRVPQKSTAVIANDNRDKTDENERPVARRKKRKRPLLETSPRPCAAWIGRRRLEPAICGGFRRDNFRAAVGAAEPLFSAVEQRPST